MFSNNKQYKKHTLILTNMRHNYPNYSWLSQDVDSKEVLCVLTDVHINPESICPFCTHLPNTLPDGGLGFSSTVSPPDRTPLKTEGATFPMRSTQQTETQESDFRDYCRWNFFPAWIKLFFLIPLADICSYLNHKYKQIIKQTRLI